MRSQTVLVVDDDEYIRDIVTKLLQELGHRVYVAADGEEAVAVFKEHYLSIELVILDMIMPMMDGRVCFSKLKEINPDVKVIISSGTQNDSRVGAALRAGALACLPKPYSFKDLTDLLEKHIGADV